MALYKEEHSAVDKSTRVYNKSYNKILQRGTTNSGDVRTGYCVEQGQTNKTLKINSDAPQISQKMREMQASFGSSICIQIC